MKLERFILGLFLIVIIFLVCNNYASNNEYYTNSDIIDLLCYPGTYMVLSGTVTDIYNGGFQVRVNSNGNFYDYKVKTLSKVNLGDTAYILGTLNSSNIITCLKVVTVKNGDFSFVIIRSIFGMLLFLIIFGKYWRFNLKNMIFIRLKENRSQQKQSFCGVKIFNFNSLRKKKFFRAPKIQRILRRK